MVVSESPGYEPATAYHEAGHAVIALVLGRPVQAVSVLPTRDRLGVCQFRNPVFRPSEDWLEREILIALAGLAAEAKHTGTYGYEEAARDLVYARKLIVQRAGERRAERLEKRLLSKVEHLLDQEATWRAVELIVVELLAQGEISGRTAVHLYERAQGE